MIKKLRLSIIVSFILIFTLTTVCNSYGSAPTHGWNGQAIRLNYCFGGPNIAVNETTGLTISRISSKSYKAFGYFTYNPFNGSIIEKHEVTFDGEGKAFIGQFEKGARIGTWLKTKHGTFHSVPGLNKGYQHRATYLGDTSDGNLKIGLEGGKKWQGSDYREMVVAFEPTEHAPAGQPLPGVIISALIGLGVAGITRIRKKNLSSY